MITVIACVDTGHKALMPSVTPRPTGHNGLYDTGHKALCPVSLARFIRAYLGVTVGSGHTSVTVSETGHTSIADWV